MSHAQSLLFPPCWADFLDCFIRELQRQIHSSRMDTDHTNARCETSRREQARLHEELAQRERALRETHIESIHEVEELKRAQEMRSDEFSRQELRESHATIQELTSQLHELQDCVDHMNDSREFQDVESICNGKTIPRSQSTSNCSKSLAYAEPRPKPPTWYMELAWYIGHRFWQSTCANRLIGTLQRHASSLESECYRWEPGARQ